MCIIFLLIPVLFFTSCSRRQETAPGKSGQEVAVRNEGQLKLKPEITLEKEDKKVTGRAEIEERQGTPQILLPMRSTGRLMPEDFKIGPLQDELDSKKNQLEIASTANEFLLKLKSGTVDTNALLEAKRKELAHSLSYHVERKNLPKKFRTGSISIKNEPDEVQIAWMNVRLFGEIGVTEGEIYFSRQAGKWYISNIQIAFELLSNTYQKPEEIFMPSIYGWRGNNL